MRVALEPLRLRFAFVLEIVDVDADLRLAALYDELVPVLVAPGPDGGGLQLCHYMLDFERVAAYLLAHTERPAP